MTENLTEKRNMLLVMENDDILYEIFLLLPTELLYRFKSVSKHWRSLISSFISESSFCSTHTQRNHKTSIFGLYVYFLPPDTIMVLKVNSDSLHKDGQSLPGFEFIKFTYYEELVILHASNGLYLGWIREEKQYAIWNLTIQELKKLPRHLPRPYLPYCYEGSAHLDFNPENSLHYKVVCVSWLFADGAFMYYHDVDREGEYYDLYDGIWYEIDIYNSETKTWKRKHFPEINGYNSQYKVLCNGAIHWITDRDFHVWFDIDTETLNANRLHPQVKTREDTQTCYFRECCGHAFLIQIERHDFEKFYIFEMDSDFRWTVKYSVNMMNILNTFYGIFKIPDPISYEGEGESSESWKYSVLSVIKEDENDEMLLLMALPGKIVLMGRTKFRVLCEFQPTEDYLYNTASAFQFIPTLRPVEPCRDTL